MKPIRRGDVFMAEFTFYDAVAKLAQVDKVLKRGFGLAPGPAKS